MILKHRDTEVLRFDWVEPFGVKNVEVNSAAERFLPLAFRDRIRPGDAKALTWAVEDWVMARKPPARRKYIDKMLSYLGLNTGNPRDLLDNGYSLFSQARYYPGDPMNEFDDPIKQSKERSSSPEDLRAMIVAALKLFPTISRQQLSERLEIGSATVSRHIKALQDAGELKRVGSRKTGYWQVVEKSPNH